MTKNSTLNSIYLPYTGISVRTAVALAAALETNTSLTRIELGSNNLLAAGGTALAEALLTNRTLRNVQIGGTVVGDEAARAFAAVLEVLLHFSLCLSLLFALSH